MQYVPRPTGGAPAPNNRAAAAAAAGASNGMRTRNKATSRQTINGGAIAANSDNGTENIPPIRGATKDADKGAGTVS